MKEKVSLSDIFYEPAAFLLSSAEGLMPVGQTEQNEKKFLFRKQWDAVQSTDFFSASDCVAVRAEGKTDLDRLQLYVGYRDRTGFVDHKLLKEIVVVNGAFSFSGTFDAASLGVYQKAECFFITFSTGNEAVEGRSLLVTDLKVWEGGPLERASLLGGSLEEILAGLKQKEAPEKETPVFETLFISPSGKKFVQAVDDNGNLFAIPTVPHKTLFIGNSLLLGMGLRYGMCASGPDKDYFHYVTQAILQRDPTAEFVKLYGPAIEMNESGSFDAIWNGEPDKCTGKPFCESFTEDVDLILLQINDNINTVAKRESFVQTADEMVRRMRTASPRARILWVHGWYNEATSGKLVREVCARWHIRDIDISDLNQKRYQSYRGATYLEADGSMATVKDNWVTHPGDEGMQVVAERILKVMEL